MGYPQETYINTQLAAESLLYKRSNAVSRNTLRYQLDVLKKTGRYDAFRLKWHPSYSDPPDVWPIPNHLFWDSDVAKWIEGACYFMHENSDPYLEHAVHELVAMIQNAQHSDGYINIHYTVVEPGKRFTNLRDMHELYNAGHLIEAALAHHNLYKNNQLLNPILRYVDLLCRIFGAGESQIHGYPGHPEIELALLRLYHRTRKEDIMTLAEYFVRERGRSDSVNGQHFYVAEAKARQEDPNSRPVYWPTVDCLWYYQAHKPIIDQRSIEGHSVRAMYLLTAVSDLARSQTRSNSTELFDAALRLWRNMVDRKMYITGGVGAIKQWEGFGIDYFLPQGTDEGGCYCETCAAIGVMMFAERMLQVRLDGEFGDIMELCLYNSVLTAMSFDGMTFTYVNQLASSDHDLSRRESWFTCACCPPNIMRLLGQIGGYASSSRISEDNSDIEVVIHLFVPSTVRVPVGNQELEFAVHTNWPWSGDVDFRIQKPVEGTRFTLRIPGWAESYQLEPPCPVAALSHGYLEIPSEWISLNPTFTLSIPIKARAVSPPTSCGQDVVSLARGPLIYCVEDVDNPWVQDHFKGLFINPNGSIEEEAVDDETTHDKYIRLSMKGASVLLDMNSVCQGPNRPTQSHDTLVNSHRIELLHFVPYFFRANRGGKGHMRVGLRHWHGH